MSASQPAYETDEAIMPMVPLPGSLASPDRLSTEEARAMVERAIERNPELAAAAQVFPKCLPTQHHIISALRAIPDRLPKYLETAEDVAAICDKITEAFGPEPDCIRKRAEDILHDITTWWHHGAPRNGSYDEINYKRQEIRNHGRDCPTLHPEEVLELQHLTLATDCIKSPHNTKQPTRKKCPPFLMAARIRNILNPVPKLGRFIHYPEEYRVLYRGIVDSRVPPEPVPVDVRAGSAAGRKRGPAEAQDAPASRKRRGPRGRGRAAGI
ncbi:hypothetical protein GGTG_07584 [Gaeumannomyces tritici R3-111a-1]|uniref:Uncharacterized protein n=1 Tax=Gaeumannomyces tritici (strain R3-111a-1) TaxID=644352 RepID=J3P236_GAET3|nr:hypothetical protein GGTG_07584 [Gaeumannomyces tritici R3-111a-1]EJT73728.1 hypothetical protein GGTG_07584 [Gaeumannomyces tritici R3-111a-1]